MKNYLLFFVIIFFFSCKENYQYPRVIIPKQVKFVKVNSLTMLHSEFINGLVSNFYKDTVFHENKIINKKEEYLIVKNADTILPKYDFRIIVDTTYNIHTTKFVYKNAEIPSKADIIIDGLIDGKIPNQMELNNSAKAIQKFSSQEINQWDQYVECYPLLIYNNEKQNSYSKKIRLIQEAKDTDGKWKPIEFFKPLPYCVGNNIFFKYSPRSYSSIAIIKYYGNFKTKLRVKVAIGKYFYYSNEFYGAINRSQFDLKYMKEYIRLFENYDEKYFNEYEDFVLLKSN